MRVLRAATGEVRALGFSPDGEALVAGYESRGLYAWELGSDAPPLRLAPDAHLAQPQLFFSPDGRIVFWLSQTGRTAADRTTGRRVPAGPVPDQPLVWFGQTPDASRVFRASGPWRRRKLDTWRHGVAGAGGNDRGEWVREWAEDTTDARTATLALDPSGERLAHLADRPIPRAWPEFYRLVVRDAANGAEVGYGRYPYSTECRLLFRPDGRLVVGFHKMTLLVWPIPGGGAPKLVRNDTQKHLTAAAFHPSGRYLFTTSNDATAVVWNTLTWERVARFTWQVGPLKSVAVSPDGMLAAAGSDQGQVVVWDVDL